jgi:hypothetical protein
MLVTEMTEQHINRARTARGHHFAVFFAPGATLSRVWPTTRATAITPSYRRDARPLEHGAYAFPLVSMRAYTLYPDTDEGRLPRCARRT